MALKDKVPAILDHVKNYRAYLDHNRVILDIFDGNLMPYILDAMKRQVSAEYFEQIKERVIPINVLKRITQKTSRSYLTNPQRLVDEKYEGDVNFYTNILYLNAQMQRADSYASLFKGYAIEPFVLYGAPKIRILPYDRFLPYSDDPVDSTYMTEFVKFMGKRKIYKNGKETIREVYHIYSNEEFISVDEEGDTVGEDLVENEGINPYGVIPFVYGNRGNDILIPTQDTDTLALTKMIPLILTDLSGAVLFQCFSIVYGIDVNSENLKMSPNAFWSLKSDKTSDKTPSVGTIKPEADIDKVTQFIMNTFSFWLETRGIRVGSIGNVDATNVASGIAKIIDEIDATELIQCSQTYFMNEERQFWQLLKVMQNYWLATNQLDVGYRPNLWLDDFNVTLQFDPIEPYTDRATQVSTVKTEVDAGFLSRREAIKTLYPDLTDEQVDERLEEIAEEGTVAVPMEEPESQQDEMPMMEESSS